jgi:hypothetical protein
MPKFNTHIINAFRQLADYLQKPDEKLAQAVAQSYANNQWFTPDNQHKALAAIAENMLNADSFDTLKTRYENAENTNAAPQKIGIVMAGNLPLVGFHDFLCVLLSGNIAVIKLSEKDRFLLPCLAQKLIDIAPFLEARIIFTDFVKDVAAVIATGSNNTYRYFEQYFGKNPNIIRRGRTSVAVLTGNESDTDLRGLGNDIFQYFGLGCRNVSKIYVPKGYNFEHFLEITHEFNALVLHNKYKNNFDYNFTLLILNKIAHQSNGCLLLTEDAALQSRIAMLHYEYYDNMEEVVALLQTQKTDIQCIVSNETIENIVVTPFGKAQSPTILDYADGVDTMAFLLNL